MREVTVSVASWDEVQNRTIAAFDGKPQGNFISFASEELLWRTLTLKRWALLKAMAGAGPMSIREAARRAGRDVKAVHGDVKVLLDTGVLNRTEGGRIEFPYDAIHVDFVMKAA